MELAQQVRKDLCSLSLEEATQYLAEAKTSKEQFFSESKYCSLHLILTEAVRNVLSQEKLESFLSSECQIDKDVRWVPHSRYPTANIALYVQWQSMPMFASR